MPNLGGYIWLLLGGHLVKGVAGPAAACGGLATAGYEAATEDIVSTVGQQQGLRSRTYTQCSYMLITSKISGS